MSNLESNNIKANGHTGNERNRAQLDKAKKILDKATRNVRKNLSNDNLLNEFKTELKDFNASDLNEYIGQTPRTLLQVASMYGLHEFGSWLLDQGADPNRSSEEDVCTPVMWAAYHGHFKMMEVLLTHERRANFGYIERHNNETVLHYLLKIPNRSDKKEKEVSSYGRCLDMLLDCPTVQSQLRRIINQQDKSGYVPLHYATSLWSPKIVRELLNRGANVGIENNWNERPISKILPKTMKEFLDEECLKSNGHPPNHDELELTFKYSFLAPPVEEQQLEESIDNEAAPPVEQLDESIDNQALPEAECLWHMGQSKEHQHLLTHPVITSFLWLKWQRISGYFNRNLRFYLLFVTALTWYIFERFEGISNRLESPWNQTLAHELNETGFCSELSSRSYSTEATFWYKVFCLQVALQVSSMISDWWTGIKNLGHSKTNGGVSFGQVLRFAFGSCWLDWLQIYLIVTLFILNTTALWIVVTILLAMLMLREAFQMSVSWKRHLLSPENLLEGLLVILVGIMLWAPDSFFETPCQTKRHIASIALVLSWAEMIILVARHPNLTQWNIYVTMFTTVLRTFTEFLIWYSSFIVAFGLGFYIMLHEDFMKNDTKAGSTPKPNFFNQTLNALIKTTGLFAGFNFEEFPIDTTNWMSILFSFAFVFFIIVILINLLNGLAISDTGDIRQQAELVCHKATIEAIFYTESILMGDPTNFLSNYCPKWLTKIPNIALMMRLFRCRIPFVHNVLKTLTGANRVLLLTTLEDKTWNYKPNDRNCCLNVPGFPSEITQAAVKIEQEKQKQKLLDMEKITETNQVKELSDHVKRLEQEMNLLRKFLMDTLKDGIKESATATSVSKPADKD